MLGSALAANTTTPHTQESPVSDRAFRSMCRQLSELEFLHLVAPALAANMGLGGTATHPTP